MLNNLGLTTCNVPLVNGQHLIDAEHYFEAAIGLDPDLLLPRVNLALTRLQRCFSLQLGVSDEGTISAAREVAERAPENPLIMMWVAECYAHGALPGDERYELAIKHLRRAFEIGLPLKALRAMKDLKPLLKDLQDRPGFEELLRNQPQTPQKLVREFELLDELGY